MKPTRSTLLSTCLLLTLSASWLHAEPLLNGLAVSTEFGKERFIAALYSDTLTADAGEMLNSSGHRRMELKVTADSISARSLNSMWIEGMAINNSASALEAQARNLAKLNNLIRKRLRAGDVLVFDAEPDNGTAVILNGIKLGTLNADEFFPMLLRTWIGSVPLSSDFKDSLLANGQVDSGLSNRYARIEPDEARIDVVATWVAPAPPQPAVTSTSIQPPKPDTSITPPRPSSSVAQADAEESSETEQVAADETSSSAASASSAQQTPEPKPEPKPTVAAAPAAQPQGTQTANRQQEPAKPTKPTQVARATPAPEPQVEDEEEDAEEVMVTAESLLLRQHYISDVMRQTLQNMRYPRRAEERRQEGSIRLAVTVARSGKLQDVRIVEESPHSLLNREALASVERASPFPEIPEGVGDETFSFGIPVTFRLR